MIYVERDKVPFAIGNDIPDILLFFVDIMTRLNHKMQFVIQFSAGSQFV